MRANFLPLILLLLQQVTFPSTAPQDKFKPLMGDFIGLCVHTVQFRPEIYKPLIGNKIQLVCDESPVYIHLTGKNL